jgi:hypothetical protein
MDAKGIDYQRYDNSFLEVQRMAEVQKLCQRFIRRKWARVLDAFARQVNPFLPLLRKAGFGSYRWVLDQAEIASEVMFRERRTRERSENPGRTQAEAGVKPRGGRNTGCHVCVNPLLIRATESPVRTRLRCFSGQPGHQNFCSARTISPRVFRECVFGMTLQGCWRLSGILYSALASRFHACNGWRKDAIRLDGNCTTKLQRD